MSETNSSTRKICSKCKESVEIDAFTNDKTRPDGKFPQCRICQNKGQRDSYKKHRETRLEVYRAAYVANKDSYKRRAKEWVAENPGRRKEIAAEWVRKNPEKRSMIQRNERLKNPGYYAAHVKARQTRKMQAYSLWADADAMRAIYRQSAFVTRFTGIKHHVDHYYPLKSDVVCGLHNQYNLRIIPAFDNLSKGNRLPE